MNNWQELLKIAYEKAQKSTNISTQNAAVLIDNNQNIILSEVNSFPNGVNETKERQADKVVRFKYSVHAERNVIYSAAKKGIKTEGLIMVCPWATCSECAQAIIQAGIKKIVVHKQALDRNGHWQDDIDFAFNMLREAGVEIVIFDGKIEVGKILRSGEYWEP
ncbi:MAG TPA: deaminase [Candidatus Pacearchaeota archaeon]|nr:deaminase [Candidatus Pacearchaeota archaeon]HPR80077.1 deaminase [Candidatus Pacearchaeota archaeon]